VRRDDKAAEAPYTPAAIQADKAPGTGQSLDMTA
jgi:hypothetical protein